MDSVGVSIIIPVYNAEKYLRKCIDSILNQTLKNIECILVDDGSTDNSYKICCEYKKKDSRVIVIKQENAGVAVARNVGIDRSCGHYISFVDADDWIEPIMIERLVGIAERHHADISICNHFHIYNESKGGIAQPISKKGIWVMDSDEDIDIYLRKFLCKGIKEYKPYLALGTPWGRIFRTQIIKENNLRFPIGIQRGEDGIFNMYAAKYSNCICFTDEMLYCYRILNNSVSHKYSPNVIQSTEKYFDELIIFAEKFMKQDEIFCKGINVVICTWFYKYLKYYFFAKQYMETQGYLNVRKKIIELLKKEPYSSAYKKADLRLMKPTERVFVYCMKRKYIEIIFLLSLARELKEYAVWKRYGK